MISTIEALQGLYVALGGELSDVENITTIPEMLTAISTVAAAGASELPAVKAADNGKLLTVVNSKWAKADAPTELPSVSGSDNGKVLTVKSGAWDAQMPTVYRDKTNSYADLMVGISITSEGVASLSFATGSFSSLNTKYKAGQIVFCEITTIMDERTGHSAYWPTGLTLPLTGFYGTGTNTPFDTSSKPVFSSQFFVGDDLQEITIMFDASQSNPSTNAKISVRQLNS